MMRAAEPVAAPPRGQGYRTSLEIAALAILCACAVAAPLLLGGTGAIARWGLEGAVAVAVGLWVVASPRPARLLVAPALMTAVFLLQILPLPPAVLNVVAPLSAALWKEAGADMPGAWHAISLDPGATAVAVRRLFLTLAMIAMVSDVAKSSASTRALLASIAVSGVVVCGLGLTFASGKDDRLLLGFLDLSGPVDFWRTPVHEPVQTAAFSNPVFVDAGGLRYRTDDWVVGDRVGPYIVSNHFAGALVLTAPAVAAIWLAVSRGLLPTLWRLAVAAAVYGVALYAVAVRAGSRAGTAALAVALLVLTAALARPGWMRRVAIVATILAVISVLVLAAALGGLLPGIDRLLPDRVAAIVRHLLADQRGLAVGVAMRMLAASPLFGTGLGTFGKLYPRFTPDDHPLYFAHNDYAQLLSEGGVIGFVAIGWLAMPLVCTVLRVLRHRKPEARLPDAAAWAAVAGIAAHSFFDWNLHVPANALLAGVCAGISLAGMRDAPSPRRAALRDRWIAATTIAVLMLTVALLTRDMLSELMVGRLRRAVAAARVAADEPRREAARERLDKAIHDGEAMAAWDPANAQFAVLVGQASAHAAAMPRSMADARQCRATAEAWFMAARRDSAICRGLPAE